MYHFEIILGLLAGIIQVFLEAQGTGGIPVLQLFAFAVRVVGTCAVFYVFFLYKMLGAGDIKLMAVCVGVLDIWQGSIVIFLGMVLALVSAGIQRKCWKYGWRAVRGMKLRLAPYLFGGYLGLGAWKYVVLFAGIG